ncbi:MAG: SGNH/GDSL hydrolase family protein, partial [Oscillospiraceae bacterium]
MKKTLKKLLSSVLSLALASSALVPIPHFASAADELIEVVNWSFDGNDAYSADWGKGGYTTTSLTPTYTITDGRLKVDEDYTVLTSTYNRVMAQYSFGESSQFDLSSAVKFTFDYYCETDKAPNSFLLVFSGKLEGASSSTTKTDSAAFSKSAVKYESSDLEGYDKYAVTIDLTVTEDFKTQRAHTARLQIGEIRTDNTYNGSVFYDNITAWKINENAPEAVIDADKAVYNKAVTAAPKNMEGTIDYQWYKAFSYTSEGTAIDGATEASYTPSIDTIGGYVYCTLTNNSKEYVSKRVRVIADESTIKETPIKLTNTTIAEGSSICFFVNTTATGSSSSYFDISKMAYGGYFYIEYTGDVSDVPQLELGTWSTSHSTTDIAATETGTASNGNRYAKYSFEACVNGWGEEDFSAFKAVRAKYSASDSADITFTKVSWFGHPVSYGELGEEVAVSNSGMLFTRHVGGDFDATRIREDSYFFIEYTGDFDGIEFVANSHSKVVGGYNEYVVISAPSESGNTGSGYYQIYTAAQIKEAFGADFRYIDSFRINTKEGKTINSKKLYFFEKEGALVDDISADGYTDAIDVPWIKYADCAQDGVVVIGASITQNPLVTPSALSGAPYYNANGGWNAVLDRTDCITYGIGSQTTINVSRRFSEILKYDYKKIIIQCGNNDLGAFYNNIPGAVNQEVSSYTTMLDLVKAKNDELTAQGKDPITVYIISLNPTNAEGLQQTIVAVNNAISELTESYDFATYINIYDDFVNDYTGSPSNPDCDEYHVNMDLVMSDGLHPVSAGYKIWAGYLKEAMQSSDPTDTTLTTLSYRMSDTESKCAVTGFETGKSTGEANTYNMALPRTTADDGAFKLY